MTYHIHIEAFEGPFDLLLHLIDKNELDIYEISIAEITEQYLAYIDKMAEMDLEITSQFLVMAARLISIKAKKLLPRQASEDEQDSDEEELRQELVTHLLEYKKYKLVADYFQNREQSCVQTFIRQADQEKIIDTLDKEPQLSGLSLTGLVQAFETVLEAADKEEPYTEVQFDEISIEDKMQEVYKKVLFNTGGITFEKLCQKTSIPNIVVTFLAILELIKAKEITVQQNRLFGQINIRRKNIFTNSVN